MSLEEFTAISGLKEAYAKQCFGMFGSYGPALAAFVQSLPNLSSECFADAGAAKENRTLINRQLRSIYARARAIKAANENQSPEDIWKAYAAAEAAGPTPPASSSAAPPASSSSMPTSSSPQPTTSTTAAPAAQASPFAAAFKNAGSGGASFGFNAPASKTAAAAAPNQPPSPAPAGKGAAGFNFGAPAAQPAAAEPEKPAKKPARACKPTHFTGCYFDMPEFWKAEVEGEAALFDLDKGYLAAHKKELRPLMERWVQKASFYKKPVKYVEIEDEDEEVVRVIIKDADRTFFHPDHRKKLVVFLNALYHEFNTYGQAMSYLAGICLLALDEEETAAVIRFVATAYIKGHWAAEAVGFATSAWVVEHFMHRLYPDVAAHLEKLHFWPDTYLQKIMSGLCIHVLPFSHLFAFLDDFMMDGMPYLIRFCLSIIEHFRSHLLSITSTTEANKLYEIMRLDRSVTDVGDINAIMARAKTIDLGADLGNLDVIRSQVYEKKVEPRISRAPKQDTFEPCDVCNTKRPTWWNEDLGAVCTDCKAKHTDKTFEKF